MVLCPLEHWFRQQSLSLSFSLALLLCLSPLARTKFDRFLHDTHTTSPNSVSKTKERLIKFLTENQKEWIDERREKKRCRDFSILCLWVSHTSVKRMSSILTGLMVKMRFSWVDFRVYVSNSSLLDGDDDNGDSHCIGAIECAIKGVFKLWAKIVWFGEWETERTWARKAADKVICSGGKLQKQ